MTHEESEERSKKWYKSCYCPVRKISRHPYLSSMKHHLHPKCTLISHQVSSVFSLGIGDCLWNNPVLFDFSKSMLNKTTYKHQFLTRFRLKNPKNLKKSCVYRLLRIFLNRNARYFVWCWVLYLGSLSNPHKKFGGITYVHHEH